MRAKQSVCRLWRRIEGAVAPSAAAWGGGAWVTSSCPAVGTEAGGAPGGLDRGVSLAMGVSLYNDRLMKWNNDTMADGEEILMIGQ